MLWWKVEVFMGVKLYLGFLDWNLERIGFKRMREERRWGWRRERLIMMFVLKECLILMRGWGREWWK